MQQSGNVFAVPIDHRRAAPLGWWQRDELALKVGPAVELFEPVDELQGGVAQSAGYGVAQIGRRGARAKRDDQVGHRGAGQPCVEQTEQEGDRRKTDGEQGREPGRFEAGLAEHRDQQQKGHHHE